MKAPRLSLEDGTPACVQQRNRSGTATTSACPRNSLRCQRPGTSSRLATCPRNESITPLPAGTVNGRYFRKMPVSNSTVTAIARKINGVRSMGSQINGVRVIDVRGSMSLTPLIDLCRVPAAGGRLDRLAPVQLDPQSQRPRRNAAARLTAEPSRAGSNVPLSMAA